MKRATSSWVAPWSIAARAKLGVCASCKLRAVALTMDVHGRCAGCRASDGQLGLFDPDRRSEAA